MSAEYFTGTEGSTWGTGPGNDGYKKKITLPEFEEHNNSPYVQEHVDLLRGIIEGKPLNETQDVAESTLCRHHGADQRLLGTVRAME